MDWKQLKTAEYRWNRSPQQKALLAEQIYRQATQPKTIRLPNMRPLLAVAGIVVAIFALLLLLPKKTIPEQVVTLPGSSEAKPGGYVEKPDSDSGKKDPTPDEKESKKPNNDNKIPAEEQEKEESDEKAPAKEQTEEPVVGPSADDQKEEDSVNESDEIVSLPLGEGWEIKGVSLYNDTVYYYGYSGYDSHMYRMKLGKGQKPEYMGSGIIYGIYDSILLGGRNGKYSLMDLSQKNPQWIDLSLDLWGKPQICYKDQLWIFSEEDGRPVALVIDLEKKTGRIVETAVSLQDAVLDGDLLYYTVKSGEEKILYQADLPSKKVKELYRLSQSQEWQYAGGRVLIYEEHKNPLVIDVKTMERFVPMDFSPNFDEIGPHIMYENPGDGTIVAEYYNKDIKKCSYWYYNIATNKGGETDGLYSDRRSFGGGYYLFAESGKKTQFFYHNGNKYEFDYDSLRDHKVDAVNKYGAAAGGKGYIYTLRWSEGNAYSAVATEDHMVSLK